MGAWKMIRLIMHLLITAQAFKDGHLRRKGITEVIQNERMKAKDGSILEEKKQSWKLQNYSYMWRKKWTRIVRFSEVMLPSTAHGHKKDINALEKYIHTPLSRNVTKRAKRVIGFNLTLSINTADTPRSLFTVSFCSFH